MKKENQILNGVAANLTREPEYRERIEEPAGADGYRFEERNFPDQNPNLVPAPLEPPVYYERRP